MSTTPANATRLTPTFLYITPTTELGRRRPTATGCFITTAQADCGIPGLEQVNSPGGARIARQETAAMSLTQPRSATYRHGRSGLTAAALTCEQRPWRPCR